MNGEAGDRLDAAIDEAAQQLVAGDPPHRMYAAVMFKIGARRNSRSALLRAGFRLAAASAALVSVIMLWKVESPVQHTQNVVPREANPSSQPRVITPDATGRPVASLPESRDNVATRPERTTPAPTVSVPAVVSAANDVTVVAEIRINAIVQRAIEIDPITITSAQVQTIELANLNVDSLRIDGQN
jgi:hypothetical protein